MTPTIFINQNYTLKKAKNQIEDLENSPIKKNIYNQIISGINEINIRIDNNFDNINNEYPLYNILYGVTNTYEFFDDPDVSAVSNAADEASSMIPRATRCRFSIFRLYYKFTQKSSN